MIKAWLARGQFAAHAIASCFKDHGHGQATMDDMVELKKSMSAIVACPFYERGRKDFRVPSTLNGRGRIRT